MSQRDVAHAVGISQSSLSDLERGEVSGRSLEILANIARTLQVSADYLLGLDTEELGAPILPGLTPGESELVMLARGLDFGRKSMLRETAEMLNADQQRRQQFDELMTAIEALDGSGLLADSHDRLFVLARELGGLGAAVTALAGELGVVGAVGATGEVAFDEGEEG